MVTTKMSRWPMTLPACLVWLAVALTFVLASNMAAGEGLDSIFPEDNGNGYGYMNYRAKRMFSDSNSDCHICLSTYDYDSCQRCWNSKPSFIPYHAKRSSSSSSSYYQRYQRSSGCGCCYLSRFTNAHCCRVCSLAAKRTGKRSGDLMADDLIGQPSGSEVMEAVDKRAMMNPDCFCCFRYGSDSCCARCYE